MIRQILRGSPLLQILILVSTDCYKDWNIESTSLKTLKIKCTKDRVENPNAGKLRIWAPNLESLEITGYFYGKCLLIDLLSLTSLTLLIFPLPTSLPRFVEEILVNVLQRIHLVENVTLSDWCYKVLGEMCKRGMVASVPSVKSLKLYSNHVLDVISLLEIFSNLFSLVVEDQYRMLFSCLNFGNEEPFVPVFDAENSETDFARTNLLHLRTVHIKWVLRDNDMLGLIQTLLKNVCTLEKMVFQVRGYVSKADQKCLPEVENMLQNLARSSPSATLAFELKFDIASEDDFIDASDHTTQ